MGSRWLESCHGSWCSNALVGEVSAREFCVKWAECGKCAFLQGNCSLWGQKWVIFEVSGLERQFAALCLFQAPTGIWGRGRADVFLPVPFLASPFDLHCDTVAPKKA